MPSSALGNMTFDSMIAPWPRYATQRTSSVRQLQDLPPAAALLASQWQDTDITPAVA